jgi:hypothetical protein
MPSEIVALSPTENIKKKKKEVTLNTNVSSKTPLG